MVHDTARMDAGLLAFIEHALKGFNVHLKGDVKIVIVLFLEIEWGIRHFKECQKGIVAQSIKTVQGTGFSPSLSFQDGESVGQG